jgi:glycosyltransferase involved in cell wall biosynthesis
LIPELVKVPSVELIVVSQQHDTAAFQAVGAETVAAPARIVAKAQRFMWEQAGLPGLVRRVRADVLHSPHYTMPVRSGVPTVVTLHDATFFSGPQLHTTVKRRFFTIATRFAIRQGAGLIVPSEATRNELIRLVSPAAGRATVAPHGVDPAHFHPPTEDEVAKLRVGLGLGDEPFIAFLGTIEPRKNVPNLIRGWMSTSANLASPPTLVLAGGAGWDSTVDEVIATVPARLRLVRPGYLPLDELRALLGGAEVVAYPALGEGFGLPVAEAMACGAVVLTTDRLALPEVGGDAVEYTAVDATAIGSALARLLDDPERRAGLAAKAVRRASLFTWERAAKIHATAYRDALQAP